MQWLIHLFQLNPGGNGLDPENDEYGRFQGFGIPPAKNGDYAFLLHFIRSLRSHQGKGAHNPSSWGTVSGKCRSSNP